MSDPASKEIGVNKISKLVGVSCFLNKSHDRYHLKIVIILKIQNLGICNLSEGFYAVALNGKPL
ncbi:hypothetical protein GL2_42000 [Microbulbifer sp. GL-2]|nr:hypothetical protein GL2_42000 [Microbulbifer sp. GL-2]